LAEESTMKSKQTHQKEDAASRQSVRGLNRRDFLRLGLAATGAIVLGKVAPVFAGRGTVTRYPLRIPPAAVLYDNFPLTAARAQRIWAVANIRLSWHTMNPSLARPLEQTRVTL
jgi:hypothetical protein